MRGLILPSAPADGDDGVVLVSDGSVRSSASVRRSMDRILRTTRRLLSQHTRSQAPLDGLICAAIKLAHCDIYYRIGQIDPRFGRPLQTEVKELRRLIEIVDWSQFRASRRCFLNPAFGEGSVMIGGADADLLLDDTLIELKTTAALRLDAHDWRQLIGYAALNVHFPIGGGQAPVAIKHVGVYFARYGRLMTWRLADVVNIKKFDAFSRWLRSYAKRLQRMRESALAEIAEVNRADPQPRRPRRKRVVRSAKSRRGVVQPHRKNVLTRTPTGKPQRAR